METQNCTTPPEPRKSCGRCPTCGRGGYTTYPFYPWVQPYWPYPNGTSPWTYPVTVTYGSGTAHTSGGSATITSSTQHYS